MQIIIAVNVFNIKNIFFLFFFYYSCLMIYKYKMCTYNQ